jgi:hypothetical protein
MWWAHERPLDGPSHSRLRPRAGRTTARPSRAVPERQPGAADLAARQPAHHHHRPPCLGHPGSRSCHGPGAQRAALAQGHGQADTVLDGPPGRDLEVVVPVGGLDSLGVAAHLVAEPGQAHLVRVQRGPGVLGGEQVGKSRRRTRRARRTRPASTPSVPPAANPLCACPNAPLANRTTAGLRPSDCTLSTPGHTQRVVRVPTCLTCRCSSGPLSRFGTRTTERFRYLPDTGGRR